MNLFKRSNQSGFTLMEIIVAIALLGVLTTAVIDQIRLAANSRRTARQLAIISRITDRVGVELSHQETCSSVANFKGKAIGTSGSPTAVTNIFAADGVTKIVSVGGEYGAQDLESPRAAGTSDKVIVKVTGIKTYLNTDSNDDNQMIIEITFDKKKGLLDSFRSYSSKIPITVVKDATNTNIDYCFNDITNSIASAIRLSCQGSTSYYDPTKSPPYGECLHNIDTTDCGSKKFVTKLEYVGDVNGNGVNDPGDYTTKTTCASLDTTCPTGKVMTGFNTDGTLKCDYPLPKCVPGQLMIKATTGEYTCLDTNVGCTGLYAVYGFAASGHVQCARYYPDHTCGAFVRSISPDGLYTCSEEYVPKTCGVGQFISGYDATGTPQCSNFYVRPFDCPANQAATGMDANGNLVCSPMNRTLQCNGNLSPSGQTYATCKASNGTVYNPGPTSTTDYCHFNLDSCPGSFNHCSAYRRREQAICTDTNSNCASAVTTRVEPAEGFSDGVFASYVQCKYYWATGRTGCKEKDLPRVFTPITQVGCF